MALAGSPCPLAAPWDWPGLRAGLCLAPSRAARSAPAAISPGVGLVQVRAEDCVVELLLHTCPCCSVAQVSPRGPVWWPHAAAATGQHKHL